MPPRLSKRQQRELEELEALGGSTKSDSADDEPSVVKSTGVFSAATLYSHEDHDDDSESSEPAKKAKKPRKKKKPTGAKSQATSELEVPASTNPSQSAAKGDEGAARSVSLTPTERKTLKKAKQKEKKLKGDELEQALAELAIQLPPQQKLSQTTAKGQSLADLLGASLQHLDAEAELRKFFGSRVVQATKTKASSPSRRNPNVLKSNLTRPQPTWWSASQREGLSIRLLTQAEIQEKFDRRSWEARDEKWWTVEYSKKYKSVTKAFMRTVLSGDPQGFYELLRKLPWHADTLLQLSEVYRHREEHAQAVDFIDRALFTYERSFLGAFNFTSGLNRLDFDRVENRPFFLALHRQVVDLQRRGCIRTSFEFARLLYSLEPWTDPHGAALHLDILSIKSNMTQWLVDIYDLFDSHEDLGIDDRLDLSLLPNWRYTHALALHILENDGNHTISTPALANAIKDFPSIVPLLADKLETTLPESIRSHPECKIETDARLMPPRDGILHLLSHLYAQRSSPIWKDHATWFSETVISTFASLPTATAPLPPTPRRTAFFKLFSSSGDLQWSVYRHVYVLESSLRRLFSFLPPEILKEKTLACDPLPPRNSVTFYDDRFFEGVDDLFAYRRRTRRERELDQRRLAQMIPDAAFRQQLEGFFQAHGLERQFPGGILQFANAMAQIPPQELEEMMVNGILAIGQDGVIDPGFLGVGAMPGQMPGEDMLAGMPDEGPPFGGDRAAIEEREHEDGQVEDEGNENEDEDEEAEEELAPMPRIIRNLLGRLWGRAAPVEEETSSSEEEQEGDPADLNAVD